MQKRPKAHYNCALEAHIIIKNRSFSSLNTGNFILFVSTFRQSWRLILAHSPVNFIQLLYKLRQIAKEYSYNIFDECNWIKMCCWIKVVHLHNLTTTDDEKSTYKQNPCTLKSIEPASSTNLVCLISTGSCHSLIYAYPKIFFFWTLKLFIYRNVNCWSKFIKIKTSM